MDQRDEHEPTQQTQPRGIDPQTGKPYGSVEIPVPEREDFDKLVRRAAKGSPKQPTNE